jgi:AAA domain
MGVISAVTDFAPTTEKTKDVGDGVIPAVVSKTTAQDSVSDAAPSPTKTKTIAGLPVLSAADQDYKLKSLFYGDAGAGKTLLAATARDVPELNPMLFMDIEGGTKTFRHKYPDIAVVRIENRYNKQKVISHYGWDLFCNLTEALTADEHFKLYVVDSLSELYALAMFKIMHELVKSKPHRDIDIPDKREWAKASAEVAREVRKLIHLPKHVIMTALRDTRTDDEGRILAHTPVLAGKLTFRIAGFFNELAYLDTTTDKGKVVRRLLTQPANKYLAKSRDDRMPSTILNPTMSEIVKYAL